MATVLFSINPGDNLSSITIATGPAVTTKYIELNVDLGANVVDNNSTTTPRAIKKSEVIEALNKVSQAVLNDVTYFTD